MICPNGTVLKCPTEAEAAICLGITPELDPEQDLRRRRRRRRPGRPGHRGLCRVGGAVGAGARPARHRRPGRRLGPHRELPRLPDRHIRPGAGRPRLHPGAEVRRRARRSRSRSAGSIAARPSGRCVCELTDGDAGAGPRRRHRLGRALPPARHPEPAGVRGRRRVLLGLADRGEAVRGRGGRAGRRRQFGRPGGGLSGAAGQAAAPDRARRPGWKHRCRAI